MNTSHDCQGSSPFFELGSRSPSIAVIELPPEKPFLVVRLQELGCLEAGADLWCTVEDETGSMEATIHANVLHEYVGRIQVGTCMALFRPALFPVAAWCHNIIIHPSCLTLVRSPLDPPASAPPSTTPPGSQEEPAEW